MKIAIGGCLALVGVSVLVVVLGAVLGFSFVGNSPAQVLTHNLSEPLNGATSAKFDIDTGDGNLTVEPLNGGEQVLATGALQYLENQALPLRTVSSSNGQATLTLRGGAAKQPWIRFPWDPCNDATLWQIHLNPLVMSDITAHTDGGNVKLDLATMIVTRVSADTGGGNIDVFLSDKAANLSVTAKSGAGNVVVHVPSGIAARIHATTGLGAVIVDPQYSKLDGNTYQSPDYDGAASKIEITLSSGAGNVVVNTK